MENESAAAFCKRNGLTSLSELSAISQVPIRTLQDWYKSRSAAFTLLVEAAASNKENKNDNS